MESLIDMRIEDDEDEVVAQHLRIFERADVQRNQIVKVRYPKFAFGHS